MPLAKCGFGSSVVFVDPKHFPLIIFLLFVLLEFSVHLPPSLGGTFSFGWYVRDTFSFIILTWKNKKKLCYQKKTWVWSGTAKNCNSGQASYTKRYSQVCQIKIDLLFYGEKGGSWEGLFWIDNRQEFREMMAFHWLSHCSSCFLIGDAMYIFSCLMLLSYWGFFCCVWNWQFFL